MKIPQDRVERGARFKAVYEKSGKTKKDFAIAAGCQPSALNQYFSGEFDPLKLSVGLTLLGIDLNWLMTGKKSETEPIDHPENRRMLHLLKELGIDSEDKLRALLNPQGIAEDIALVMRERMLKYQKKRGKR